MGLTLEPASGDSPTPKARVEDGLLAAHEFVSSVTAWTGHEDDRDEALAAVNDALFALERLPGSGATSK